MERILVYKLDYGDATTVILHELQDIIDWIKADCEFLTEDEIRDLEYTITLEYMTQEQIDNLPEL